MNREERCAAPGGDGGSLLAAGRGRCLSTSHGGCAHSTESAVPVSRDECCGPAGCESRRTARGGGGAGSVKIGGQEPLGRRELGITGRGRGRALLGGRDDVLARHAMFHLAVREP
jgi:hypothetical protein